MKVGSLVSEVPTVLILLSVMVSAFAFAELVDNALAATADNEGAREIEIRLVRFVACSLNLYDKSLFIVDSLVPLMHQNPSDLG